MNRRHALSLLFSGVFFAAVLGCTQSTPPPVDADVLKNEVKRVAKDIQKERYPGKYK